jgi:hypothetical protein
MALNAKANPNYVPISEANALKDLLKSSQNQRSAQEALSENTGSLLLLRA